MRHGFLLGPAIGGVWGILMAISVAVVLSFWTGDAIKPALVPAAAFGAWAGYAVTGWRSYGSYGPALVAFFGAVFVFWLLGLPVTAPQSSPVVWLVAWAALITAVVWPVSAFLSEIGQVALNRHEAEGAMVKFMTGSGYVLFTAIVAIPFYVMVMTSLKSQQALLANPLDFSLDFSKGSIFRSYIELFRDFNFGSYLVTSFFVSVATVAITLLFSIPGAYAVARLKFKGQAVMARSILLIYMVPMIVLALPIYIAFSMMGLRNTIIGILLVYPVTTIPVALYMLQGYFRGIPAEVEEAGLMDGLSRLAVIWKITLPLSLPALASTSLYIFMIAWNEFLLAFMLLDDPSKFTLTRGVAMLNSSEIPRQHLMAGSVIATVPIMVIFLGLERFMTKGLTAGSVKG